MKKITQTVIQIVLCANVTAFPLTSFSDSRNVLPLNAMPVIQNYATTTAVYPACFNGSAGGGAQVTDPVGSSDTPYYLQLGPSVTDTILKTITTTPATTIVPVTGYYYFTLNLVLQQDAAGDNVQFWVEDYAFTTDVAGSLVLVRLLYSGDVPYLLNAGADAVSTVTFTGGMYLQKGATISSPRIWAVDAITGAPAKFCINSTSEFKASLLKPPY